MNILSAQEAFEISHDKSLLESIFECIKSVASGNGISRDYSSTLYVKFPTGLSGFAVNKTSIFFDIRLNSFQKNMLTDNGYIVSEEKQGARQLVEFKDKTVYKDYITFIDWSSPKKIF